jgi:hypothetical protein
LWAFHDDDDNDDGDDSPLLVELVLSLFLG